MIDEAKDRLLEANEQLDVTAQRAGKVARRSLLHTVEQVAKVVAVARRAGLVDPARWLEPKGRRVHPLAFVGGVLVGAGAAILFAPASGSATIRRLAQWAGLDDRPPASGNVTPAARDVLHSADAVPGVRLHEGRPT